MASFSVSTIHSASDIPAAVWSAFRENAQASNVMYAHADKAAKYPTLGGNADLWMVVWDLTKPSETSSAVLFVLSCTAGPLGPYPIFIFTPLPSTLLVDNFVRPRLLAMVRALRAAVSPERVFSVFAVDALTDAFAASWTAETGIKLDSNPLYYHASLMYCDRTTLRPPPPPPQGDGTIALRLAAEADVRKVAVLCQDFSATSEPFVLSCEKAVREAELLVQKRQLWVYEIQCPGREPEIACIVAVTRTTATVAGITKVFTDSRWRSRGCAERLTWHVCQYLLETKDTVVLYVGHNNPAAKVYRRVGFVGFASEHDGKPNSWKELGFDSSKIELGHW
ncbi:hypothetical protein L226DRAFT_555942 [Lentinus tigrinus ALCF2SS1-7]|uniref:uncharacterized protein n=1 Tax=Lentinus tigrinus ALCF2SS1-7 TaxID=1328758 RepID=UPI00116620D5|nr:hypothetical protein L226DRAFT_555942 [Lentinus tigrinus ALCF2SS1-7]